ncbi:pr1-like protein [Oryza sativa Japonica Group]|uniref:Pr1-like protein n=1 Tax=Oryza sativa subsp. japonica TaxID=39947 RepID=Q5Z827_ORYSJ|nr:pr1-like protein [Oryza sativa Japonica Group]
MRAGTAGCGAIRGGGGARARARRRARREEGDDRWAPPVSESGGRARLSAARARGRSRWAGGKERERGKEWAEPAQEGRRRGKRLLLGFSFYKPFQLCLFLFNYYLCSENSTKI